MKRLLEEDLEQDKEFYILGDVYSLDPEGKQPIDFEQYGGFKKRLNHYKKWCAQHNESFGFDTVIFLEDGENFQVKVRRSYIEKEGNRFRVRLYKAVPISKSSLGMSLKLLDNVQDPVLVSDAEPVNEPGPRLIYANKAFEKESGYSIHEIYGKNPRIMQGEDTSQEARDNIRTALKDWKSVQQEIKNYTKEEEPFYTELNISPVSDEAGWWTHWVSFQRNVTKQKIKEASNERIQKIAKVGYWSLNVETQHTFWSSEVYDIHQIPQGTPTSKLDAISFYAPQERKKISNYVERCITHKETFDDVFEFYDKKGNKKWVRSYGQPLIQSDGDVVEIFGTFQDITESVTERDRLQKILDYTPHIIYRLNKDGFFTFISSAWETLLGHDPNEVIGRHFREFVHKDDIEVCAKELLDLIEGRRDETVVEYRVFNKDGEQRYHRTHGIVFHEQTASFQGIASDVTEEKKLKEELQSILDATNVGIWRWNVKDNSLLWDESMYTLYGLQEDDFSGHYEAWKSSLHPHDMDMAVTELNDALDGKKDFNTNFRIISKNGEIKYIHARAHIARDKEGRPTIVRGINLDKTKDYLSKQREQEEQKKTIIQSRLASIGELAAGVGHEINNPLAIAMGNLEKIYHSKESWNDVLKAVETIKNAHIRIQKITDGLRNFSRADKESHVFDLVESLSESLAFVENIYRSDGINVHFNSNTARAYIKGNRAEIQQVVMNLISNAKDAIERQTDPEISITLEKVPSKAIIKITDNGSGIPDEIQDKVFESFFTSKGVGKGTGIGLSLVNQIVSDHDGTIRFETEKGVGTSFIVELPLSVETAHPPENPEAPKEDEQIFNQYLSILIAEDEEGIRDVFECMFMGIGCKIDFAEDGQEALSKFRDGHFDLIISDIQMPKMTGIELLESVRAHEDITQPKFLFITGGVNFSEEFKPILNMCDGFIEKPFTEEDLIKSINQAFQDSKGAPISTP